MSAFVLILAALASRIAALSGWFNFTAVGGSLLYFGARRPLRQAAWALVPFMAMDVYLTTRVYRMAFHAQDYLITWLWYAAVLVLGSLLLEAADQRDARRLRLAAGIHLLLRGQQLRGLGRLRHVPAHARRTHRLLRAALPFYRNDLVSTLLVTGVAFGAEALVRRSRQANAASHGQIAA